jgi:fatty aldehyde-generating acyl-ACP reductase
MDHQPSVLKFGAIGHQDTWEKVQQFVNTIRELKSAAHLSLEQIKNVYGFIPPRRLFDVTMQSTKSISCNGVYVETFIAPDELDAKHLRSNLCKVKEACQYAARLQIPVVGLGGFSSIILESNGYLLTQIGNTYFTTGNTLTSGFIVKGIKKACTFWNQPLQDSTVLVIGSTGDIGSACTQYLAREAGGMLLCARQLVQLQQQAILLKAKGITVMASTNVNELLPFADVVICVASSLLVSCNLSLLPSHAIICDAGYPKNLQHLVLNRNQKIFYGGLGVVQKGYCFDPDYALELYRFPVKGVAHGCLLEAIVLAMEGIPKAFSTGRGNITTTAIDEILEIALSHGIVAAPLFNEATIWEENDKITQHETYNWRTGAIVKTDLYT